MEALPPGEQREMMKAAFVQQYQLSALASRGIFQLNGLLSFGKHGLPFPMKVSTKGDVLEVESDIAIPGDVLGKADREIALLGKAKVQVQEGDDESFPFISKVVLNEALKAKRIWLRQTEIRRKIFPAIRRPPSPDTEVLIQLGELLETMGELDNALRPIVYQQDMLPSLEDIAALEKLTPAEGLSLSLLLDSSVVHQLAFTRKQLNMMSHALARQHNIQIENSTAEFYDDTSRSRINRALRNAEIIEESTGLRLQRQRQDFPVEIG